MAKKAKTQSEKDTNLLADIISGLGLKKSEYQVINEKSESSIPWKVPFNHIGLQKITGGLLGGGLMIVEGDSGSGKSYLAYELVGNAIKVGGVALLVDTEQAFEPSYAWASGVPKDSEALLVTQKTVVEDIFILIRQFIVASREKLKDSSIPIVCIIDSIVPTRCKAQHANDLDDKDTGFGFKRRASAIYEQVALLVPILREEGAAVVIINQLGKDTSIMFGDQGVVQLEKLRYYAHQRIRGTLAGTEKDSDDKKIKVGQKVTWKTLKNRFVRPLQEVTLMYEFEKGLKKYSGLFDLLLRDKLVTKKEKKSEEDGRIKIKGCVVNEDESKKFWSLKDAREMFDAYPNLLEPRFVSSDKMTNEESLEDMDD